jgi:renalase
MPTTLIIGAGLAGLTAARHLTQRGQAVILLDKGRGVGGRLATRRIEHARADHGAQYFSARTPDFQQLVQEMIRENVVTEWRVATGEDNPFGSRYPRYIGTEGMNGIAKYLARDLTILTNERVVKLEINPAGGCFALTEADQTYTADRVICTLPAPQALSLLHDSQFALAVADEAALQAIHYQPCIAVMVLLNAPSRIPTPGAFRFGDDNPISWVADNTQKGISPSQPSVTIHASAAVSAARFDSDLDTLARELIGQLAGWIPADSVVSVQTHRWRYSLADVRHPEPFLAVPGPFPLLLGGDGFGMGNVEGAFVSGLMMGQA